MTNVKVYPEVEVTTGHFTNDSENKEHHIVILTNVRLRWKIKWYLVPLITRMSSKDSLNLSEAFTMFNRTLIILQRDYQPEEKYLDPNQKN